MPRRPGSFGFQHRAVAEGPGSSALQHKTIQARKEKKAARKERVKEGIKKAKAKHVDTRDVGDPNVPVGGVTMPTIARYRGPRSRNILEELGIVRKRSRNG